MAGIAGLGWVDAPTIPNIQGVLITNGGKVGCTTTTTLELQRWRHVMVDIDFIPILSHSLVKTRSESRRLSRPECPSPP